MSRRTRGSTGGGWERHPGEGRSAFLGGIVKVCAFIAVLALVAIGGILLVPLVEQQQVLDEEVAALEEQRDIVAGKRDRVRSELDWLTHDPEYIETVARDELDQFKPGEVIFRIERE